MPVEDLLKPLAKMSLEPTKAKVSTPTEQKVVSWSDFQALQLELKKLAKQQSNQNKVAVSKPIIEKDPPKEFGKDLRPTKLPEFHGNRSRYPAWRKAVLDTFRMDWNLFGYDNSRAFLMIYNSLKDNALERAGPFYEAGGVEDTRDPEDFIEFLDRLYLDATRVSQANLELHAMKMRENERWAEFFASWSNKLTEARGDFWPDQNKISMLQNAMSKKLTRALIGNHLLPDDDFGEWVQIVNKIAQQVERAEKKLEWFPKSGTGLISGQSPGIFRQGQGGGQTSRASTDQPQEMDNVGTVDNSGDTIMGGINAANAAGKGRRRAKWKSKAEVDRLRQEGKCFRCERKGCISRFCPLLPARRPAESNLKINATELPEIDPSVWEEDVEQEQSVSEN